MKKKILGLLLSLFLVVGLTQSASAALTNWGVDVDGGGDSIADVGTFVDITSPNLVHWTNETDFENYGLFQATTTNGDPLPMGSITGDYSFVGSIASGAVVFSSGTMNLYSSLNGPGPIATFNVTSGYGESTTPQNGTIDINYVPTMIAPGFLFFFNGVEWMDMATEFDPLALILGITTTNANPNLQPTIAEKEALKDLGDLEALGKADFFQVSGGQFTMSAVPIPSAVLLLGSGLAALVGFRRKNS